MKLKLLEVSLASSHLVFLYIKTRKLPEITIRALVHSGAETS
jgi:hypothetical protein